MQALPIPASQPVRRFLIAASLLLSAGSAGAAESPQFRPDAPTPPPPETVEPAAYRIVVQYDDATLKRIRHVIERETDRVIDEYDRRLKLSQEVIEEQLKKELANFRRELEAIRKASREERAARARGDLAEAERWRRIRLERTRIALQLARRVESIRAALQDTSVENWRATERDERIIAEKALLKLEAALKEIEKRKR